MRGGLVATIKNVIRILRRAERVQGFTLVELLVVLLILGILIAIAVPTFLGQQDKAKDSKALAVLSTGYKVAKAEAAMHDSKFVDAPDFSLSALASAIQISEPELTVSTSGTSLAELDPSAMAKGTLYLTDDTSATNLSEAVLSDSNKLCTLVVEGNKSPEVSCDPVVPIPPAPKLADLPITDSLMRTEFPLAGNWNQLAWDTASPPTGRLTTSGWRTSSAGSISGAYWTPTSFAGSGTKRGTAAGIAQYISNGCQASAAGSYFAVWVNMQSPASEKSGYELQMACEPDFQYTVNLLRWVNGSSTSLGSKANVSLSTSRIAVTVIGGTVTGWVDNYSTGYVAQVSATDSTFTSGYTGFEEKGNLQVRNFISGVVSPG